MTDRTDTLPRIEPVVARLHQRFPRVMDLSLDRLRALLARFGHPERRLPPTIHVAGTNGKGSTCAMLRAVAEAAGMRVHVYTSPHLVRFNERYRVGGALADNDTLADTFEEIERVNGSAAISVFEVFTAAAFLLFARAPAELCVLETGLGGRGDATNVIERPAACAITSISLDHREMLGDTLPLIAAEKAGIMKPDIPVATGNQPPEVLATLRAAAAKVGAPFLARGEAWAMQTTATGVRFDGTDLPAPSLPGPHQVDNAGVALAAMAAAFPHLPRTAFAGIAHADWPARLQRLHGRLAARLPPGTELWLDGGHNPGGGEALAAHLRTWSDRPTHVIVGMKQAKDTAEFLRPLIPHATTLWAAQEPGQHQALPIRSIVEASGGIARPGPTVAGALQQIPPGPSRVLICGSLYLAGEVLKLDGVTP